MWTTNFYQIFFKNSLLHINGWLSKIRSLHTYDMYRMFYFERYCTTTYDKNCLIVSQLLRFLKGEQKKIRSTFVLLALIVRCILLFLKQMESSFRALGFLFYNGCFLLEVQPTSCRQKIMQFRKKEENLLQKGFFRFRC